MNPSDKRQGDATQEAAFALRDARATRRTIGPISVSHGIAGLAAAYAVAEVNTRARLDAGRRSDPLGRTRADGSGGGGRPDPRADRRTRHGFVPHGLRAAT